MKEGQADKAPETRSGPERNSYEQHPQGGQSTEQALGSTALGGASVESPQED
ncbi:hypothetical protein [Actinomycetospora soli]|uniref:hypothetical protein n=1 Tax=Actinomycetospora soli TaxID=2893887 RepID=UPI001E5B2D94|nr:hypothetical protein [Actinomycetospora soli]MCD2190981.1 hypothetical protein [Actinomycetospora soli]